LIFASYSCIVNRNAALARGRADGVHSEPLPGPDTRAGDRAPLAVADSGADAPRAALDAERMRVGLCNPSKANACAIEATMLLTQVENAKSQLLCAELNASRRRG
jgi:hypothetical protein